MRKVRQRTRKGKKLMEYSTRGAAKGKDRREEERRGEGRREELNKARHEMKWKGEEGICKKNRKENGKEKTMSARQNTQYGRGNDKEEKAC